MFLQRSPGADDFQLAGYTYFSDGTQGGHKLEPEDREPRRMESLLKSEHGWSDSDIRKYKEKMMGRKVVVQGPDRLAKLCPVTPHVEGENYPPGHGVFQLKILRPLPSKIKAKILPAEEWLGDYL